MHRLRSIAIAAFGLSAAACTTETVGGSEMNLACVMTGLCNAFAAADPDSAGPEWSVRPVRNLDPEGVTWSPGPLQAGDTVRVHSVTFGRHGVLEEALPGLDGRVRIPDLNAGTVFFPVELRSRGRLPLTATDRAFNTEVATPTSWCTALQTPDSDGETAVCLFYRNTEEYALRMTNRGSPWHVTGMSEDMVYMRPGQVQLQVVDAPLDRRLTYSLVVDRIRRNRIEVTEYVDDGVERAAIGALTLRASRDGMVPIAGPDGISLYRIESTENGRALTLLTSTGAQGHQTSASVTNTSPSPT